MLPTPSRNERGHFGGYGDDSILSPSDQQSTDKLCADARPNQRINDAKDWCPVTPPSLTISPTISPSSIAPSSAQRSSTKDAYKPDKRYSAPEHPRALVSPRSLSVANAARLPSPPRRNKADRPVEGQADNQRRQSASGSGYERRRRERTKEKAKQYRHKKKAERPRGEAQRYRPNYGPDTPVRTGGGKPRRGD